jgi:uncharacterized protein (DUF2235 family)
MKGYKKYVLLMMVFIINGCSMFSKPEPQINLSGSHSPKHLFVFFDGTANDPCSDTNVWQLLNLLNEDKNNASVSSFYIEGVGAKKKVVGMATGWGTRYRVKKGYRFLAKYYNEGDKIYIIGFSRGAYQARILASMLYYGGLPTTPVTDYDVFVSDIYDAFKGKQSGEQRRENMKNVAELQPVDVEFLGLWDTVEALGTPNYEEDIDLPNTRYGDQLCNVKHAAHAMALDDNRANIFTPILLTRNHLLSDCDISMGNDITHPKTASMEAKLNAIVNEVWFSGAHANVGGGYADSALNGISLNWMIKQLHQVEPTLLSNAKAKEADPNGVIHEPESELLHGAVYHKKMRSLYAYTGGTVYNDGYLKVHSSAIKRLETPDKKAREYEWWLIEQFPRCFRKNKDNGFDFLGKNKRGCNIEKVD